MVRNHKFQLAKFSLLTLPRLSVANLVLIVFLSMKNTPLAYLTAWSYDKIHILHQIAGYTVMALVIIHGACYSSYFMQTNNRARLLVHEEIYGMVAGGCFLTLVVAAAVVRLWWYELFYIIHVSFFLISMVFLGLHQSDTAKKIFIGILLAAGLFFLDRIIRFFRMVLYSVNNKATVYPLPNGGTRIVLRKAPLAATSGAHCFVWIPGVRALEMHPFTIAAMNPMEFVVNSYDGFTGDLHRYAVANPGGTLKASAEGPYGTFPEPMGYDKIIFIAGGSGASFTFGMALNMLKKMASDSTKTIIFVWIVRNQGSSTLQT